MRVIEMTTRTATALVLASFLAGSLSVEYTLKDIRDAVGAPNIILIMADDKYQRVSRDRRKCA